MYCEPFHFVENGVSIHTKKSTKTPFLDFFAIQMKNIAQFLKQAIKLLLLVATACIIYRVNIVIRFVIPNSSTHTDTEAKAQQSPSMWPFKLLKP